MYYLFKGPKVPFNLSFTGGHSAIYRLHWSEIIMKGFRWDIQCVSIHTPSWPRPFRPTPSSGQVFLSMSFSLSGILSCIFLQPCILAFTHIFYLSLSVFVCCVQMVGGAGGMGLLGRILSLLVLPRQRMPEQNSLTWRGPSRTIRPHGPRPVLWFGQQMAEYRKGQVCARGGESLGTSPRKMISFNFLPATCPHQQLGLPGGPVLSMGMGFKDRLPSPPPMQPENGKGFFGWFF